MIQARKYIFTLIVVGFAFAALAMPAHAAPRGGDVVLPPSFGYSHAKARRGAKPALYAQKKISPAKAKSIARKKMPNAKYNDISLRGNRYKVRMIRKKDGAIVDIIIDASSGRVLN